MTTYGFNAPEALRIAIEIERAGERYYRALIKLSHGKDAALLERLARDEGDHAAHFEQMLHACEAEDALGGAYAYDAEAAAYLSALAAGLAFPGGVMREVIGGAPLTASRVLLTAIDAEKSSLLYYQALLEHAASALEGDVFRRVIGEERRHLVELTDMLARLEEGGQLR